MLLQIVIVEIHDKRELRNVLSLILGFSDKGRNFLEDFVNVAHQPGSLAGHHLASQVPLPYEG